jgi:hypothetical protein
MREYKAGQIIKMMGTSKKVDSGVFEIDSIYNNGTRLIVYKLKRNGERVKSKYAQNIFKTSYVESHGQLINGEDIKEAIKEVNRSLKERKENETVISYEVAESQEVKAGSYIKIIKSISVVQSFYDIPKNVIYKCNNIGKEKENFVFHKLGKKGKPLSTYNTSSYAKVLISFRPDTLEKLIVEGYIIVIDRIEKTRKEIEDQEKEEKTEKDNKKLVLTTAEESQNIEEEKSNNDNKEESSEEEKKQDQNLEIDSKDVEITFNKEKNGIEIKFLEKPNREILAQLNFNGFRWSKFQGIWYAKDTEKRREFIKIFDTDKIHKIDQKEINYPEIEIDDIESYTVNKELSRRENNSSWIFRNLERDHTKEIQDYFRSYQNQVLNIIDKTDERDVIYRLKKALQQFKKNYFKNYIAKLTNKANNPSWVVTGPAGRNKRKDQKAANSYDRLMGESIEIEDKMKKAINKAQGSIEHRSRGKFNKKFYEILNNTEITIKFKIEKKTIDKYEFRTYNYKKYMIAKAFGCYRVYKDGVEIKSFKTTDKLEIAKKYVCLLVSGGYKEAV